MDKDEEELEREDEIFEELAEEDRDEISSDATVLNEDEADEEFLQESVDVDDLASDFSTSIPTVEVDVDEDTQGDEGAETNGEILLTELEVDDRAGDVVHGDELALDLEEAFATGKTVVKAPEDT